MLKYILVMLFILFCSGCSSGSPFYVDNNYYMATDGECPKYMVLDDGDILDCQDSNGRHKSYKSAMSEYAVESYYHQKEEPTRSQGVLSSGSPFYVDNNYYMTTDGECPKYMVLDDGDILDCQDSNGRHKSYKSAMSEYAVESYYREYGTKNEEGSDGSFFQGLSAFVIGMGEAMSEHDFSTTYPTPSTYSSKSYGSGSSAGTPIYRTGSTGTPIYSLDECKGSVVNGRCLGTIIPNPSTVRREKCYGTVVNGECMGTVR